MATDPPNWAQIVADLVAAELTQVEIAQVLGVRQSTVSDIARSVTTRPSYDVGAGLLRLHAERVGQRQEAA